MHSSRSTNARRYEPREVGWFLGKLSMIALALFVLLKAGAYILDRWHPPVDVHRTELLETASKTVACPSDQLSVVAETPVRARVTGCERTQFFQWRKAGRNVPLAWTTIDPSCTVEVYGFTVSCY